MPAETGNCGLPRPGRPGCQSPTRPRSCPRRQPSPAAQAQATAGPRQPVRPAPEVRKPGPGCQPYREVAVVTRPGTAPRNDDLVAPLKQLRFDVRVTTAEPQHHVEEFHRSLVSPASGEFAPALPTPQRAAGRAQTRLALRLPAIRLMFGRGRATADLRRPLFIYLLSASRPPPRIRAHVLQHNGRGSTDAHPHDDFPTCPERGILQLTCAHGHAFAGQEHRGEHEIRNHNAKH